jgi:hypothetical protein
MMNNDNMETVFYGLTMVIRGVMKYFNSSLYCEYDDNCVIDCIGDDCNV